MFSAFQGETNKAQDILIFLVAVWAANFRLIHEVPAGIKECTGSLHLGCGLAGPTICL